MRLTADAVSRLRLPAGKTDHIEFDDDMTGFGVRLRSGSKPTWVIQYRVGRKQRRMTLGHVEKVSASAARKAAEKKFGLIANGHDPQGEKQKDREDARSLSKDRFKPLAERFLAKKAKELRASSFDQVQRHLLKYAAPLHKYALPDIDRRRIKELLSELEKEAGVSTRNRTRTTLVEFFIWAMGEDIVQSNPLVGTEKLPEASRDRILTDDELRAIWNACGSDQYSAIVRLLILTGQRRTEVGGIAVSEIDLANKVWTLTSGRTKNKLVHDVPLSGAALLLMQEAARRTERALLFGEGEGPYSGWSRAKERLDAKIAVGRGSALEHWTLHDIRRTVITGMNTIGILPHIVEAVVNHISGDAKKGVAGVYNKAKYNPEKRQALDRWADHVKALLMGSPSNVVPLRA